MMYPSILLASYCFLLSASNHPYLCCLLQEATTMHWSCLAYHSQQVLSKCISSELVLIPISQCHSF